jgi:hypothetical protein
MMIASAYEAAVLLDDVPGEPKSQSGTDLTFGGEEWLK